MQTTFKVRDLPPDAELNVLILPAFQPTSLDDFPGAYLFVHLLPGSPIRKLLEAQQEFEDAYAAAAQSAPASGS